jgi:hypothetical protein
MGVDIFLESVWKAFEPKMDRWERERETVRRPNQSVEEAVGAINNMYAFMVSSGGYFRGAYNQSDVMPAMGLSWNDVYQMLDDDGRYLPVGKARDLLAMIEARPITKEAYTKHYLQIRAGMHNGPVGEVLEVLGNGNAAVDTYAPLDEWFDNAVSHRDTLIGLLRKSIELNEPLLCSM